MCGTIRACDSVGQCVSFGLAFAESQEPVNAKDRRSDAEYFIENYAPAEMRAEAKKLLAGRTNAALTTNLKYWRDVVR